MCSVVAADRAPLADRQSSPRSPQPLNQLEREICELAAHLAAATCRWLLLVGEFDQRGGWTADGILSCAHWLSWRCSIGLRTAREHVRVARRLQELPLVREAFARGELSYCKVRALTRVVTTGNESGYVELARHATGAQLEKVVRGYRSAVRASTGQANRAYRRRELCWYFDDDGSLVFRGRLPAEEGALLINAIDAIVENPPPAECSAEHPTEAADNRLGARRADALVAMARGSLERESGNRIGGEPVELVVHVDAATLTSERINERSEIAHGPSLAPETARRLGCDAGLVRIIERDGRPLSISRRARTIPPALRRALRARDHGCAFPGCTHTRYLHAHHIHHWARGGRTELANLVQLCSHHHRLVHEGGFRVESTGSKLRFRRPDGREIPHAPRPARARGAAIGHRRATTGIDHTTIRPLSAGDTLDYSIAAECLLRQAARAP